MQLDSRDIGVLLVESPGVRNEWEMLPEQDELQYLLDGAIWTSTSERILWSSKRDTLHLTQGWACPILKEMWHRQSRMLFRARCCFSGDDPSGMCAQIRMARSDRLLPTDFPRTPGRGVQCVEACPTGVARDEG